MAGAKGDNMFTTREQTIPLPENVETLQGIEKILASDQSHFYISSDKEIGVELPKPIIYLLKNIVSSMRRGQAITIAPHAMRLTTQEAADLLGISRPTLIKLLEAGKIPFETPNWHRRIRLLDLLVFQESRHIDTEDRLGQLAKDALEVGSYSESHEKYESALREARRKYSYSSFCKQTI